MDATAFKFEKAGDRLDGYYLKTESITIEGREVKKHVFATAKGLVSVLGQADMAQQLKDNDLGGRRVVITFSGKVQKLRGGKTMKLYDVDFDRADVYKTPDSEPELAEGTEAYADEYTDEEEVLDEVQRTTARKPAHAAVAPDAAAQARVQALLGRNRTK